MGNAFCCNQIEPQDRMRYIRLLIVGDSGVGKTSIINQVCYNKFEENTSRTQSQQTYTFISTRELKVFLIDTGGASQYKSCLAPSTVAKADGIIYVYDQSDEHSLQGVQLWYEQIEKLLLESSIFSTAPKQYLIANKEDKVPQQNIQISKNSSGSQDANFQLTFSTSALSKRSLDRILQSIVADIQKKQWNGMSLVRDLILKKDKTDNCSACSQLTTDEDLIKFMSS